MAVEVPFLSDISAFLKSVECVLGITFGKTTIPLSNQISRRSHLENLLNLLCLSFSACSPRLSKDGQNALIWIQLILKGRHLTQRPFWQLAFLRSPSSGNLQQEIPSVALKPRETSQKKDSCNRFHMLSNFVFVPLTEASAAKWVSGGLLAQGTDGRTRDQRSRDTCPAFARQAFDLDLCQW